MIRKVRYSILLLFLLITAVIFFLVVRGKDNGIRTWMKNDKYFNYAWATDKLWDDGTAEVAIYQAERNVYGRTRYYDYVYILVKETFNEKYQVKTDDYNRNDLFDVMKINKFARIETENYPYHYLSSLFLKRDDPVHLYKFTNSSQEWCGNTFKHFSQQNGGYEYIYDSYWDQEGRGSTTLPPDVFFEDQLSYLLRTLKFKNDTRFDCQIVESQITNKAPQPKIYESTVTIHKNEINLKELAKYNQHDIWEVRVILDPKKTNIYWISGNYPNELLKMVAWDGRKLTLKRIYREAYWQGE